MLREIKAVRQDAPGLTRRWFQDGFFDLYTWQAGDGHWVGFQLSYDVRGTERMFSWHQSRGFSHYQVDADNSRYTNPSPILVAGSRFAHRVARLHFTQRAHALEPALRELVLHKMREYGRALARGIAPRRIPRKRNQREHAAENAAN